MNADDLDRTLPHALDAERSVLGAILLHAERYHDAAAVIGPDDFYRDAHRRIFAAMTALHGAQVAIDFVTVCDALRSRSELDHVGGPAYVASLADGVPHGLHVAHYAGIVREKAILRGVVFAANKALTRAYDAEDGAAVLLEDTYADLQALAQRASPSGFVGVADLLPATIADLEHLADPGSRAWGVRTGLPALDRPLRGLRPGRFIVIAARPGVGKTSLAMTVAAAVAAQQTPVGVFSLEMGKDELMQMLVCQQARINIEDLADGKLNPADWQRFTGADEAISALPLFLDDGTDLNVLAMHAKGRRLQREHGLGLLVVDYLQLMQSRTRRKGVNREEELSEISRGCKLLAKDLAVPVIACCQLNRASEARDDKRPQLSDLRGSGSIEQDADTVVMIHRPDMYPPKKKRGLLKTPQVIEDEQMRGVAELIIAKNRGLRSGETVRLLFRKEYTRFEPLQF